MPKRYVCEDCIEVSDSRFKKECPSCGKELEKVEISRDLESVMPYFLAAAAALLLLFSHIFDLPILIWFTFPLIGVGLIYDHFYQKQLTDGLKKMIRKKKFDD